MADGSVWRLVLGLVLLGFTASFAATTVAAIASEEVELEQEQRAPVVVDGVVLFTVRGVSAFPAEVRAERIAERIVALAADPAFTVDMLRIDSQREMTAVMGGNVLLMSVHDADARFEGIGRDAIATAMGMRIGEAIEGWRTDRSPGQLRRDGLFALAVTVGFVLALWAVTRLFRWLRDLNERRVKQRIRDVAIAGFRIVRAQQIAQGVTGGLRLLWALVVLGTLYAYLSSVLVLFPWTRGFAGGLIDLVVNPLRTMALGFLGALPDLVFLALIFLLTRYLLRLVHLYFRSVEDGSLVLKDFDADWAMPTYRLLRLLLVAFALIVAYPYVPGSGSEAFKGISIFIGVVFSLGSSSVISNMIAGYTMTYRRVFKVGDRVMINDHVGDVDDVRMLVTYLRTPKNEIVAVPNSEILNGEVVNYSALAATEGLILHTTVGIGYETPWRQVEAMLLEAAARTSLLLKEPPPFVLQKALGDFCVTYEINAWTHDARAQGPQYTQLHRNILDIFNEYGVQIMTPAYEGDPEVPKVVPKDQWFAAPAPISTPMPNPPAGS